MNIVYVIDIFLFYIIESITYTVGQKYTKFGWIHKI